jgi:short-subunit dehydrogenase
MNTQRFAQRAVIVTGASSGLGVAIARAFAAEGAAIVLAARNADRLRQVAAGFSGEILAVPCDVSKRADVDNLITQTLARFGRLDILVNNAGAGMVAPVEFVEMRDAETLFETNFFGAFHCIQAALPHLKQQRRAHIVNVASISGLRAIPNIAIYSAAKAALVALSDSLRIELRGTGVGVTAVCPGRITDTAFFEQLTRYGPLKLYEGHQVVTPDAVAQAILEGVLKRRRLVILPSDARLLYRVNRFAPRLVDNILHKKMPKLEKSH